MRGSYLFRILGVAGVIALSGAAGPLGAQPRAMQVVNFRILPASQAAMAPVAQPLATHAARPAESRTSYSIGTNSSNRKITASLDRAMTAGATLSVALAPPSGATSSGPTALDTISTDVVTDIPAAVETPLPVVYTLRSASVARFSNSDAADERVVVYTIVAGP